MALIIIYGGTCITHRLFFSSRNREGDLLTDQAHFDCCDKLWCSRHFFRISRKFRRHSRRAEQGGNVTLRQSYVIMIDRRDDTNSSDCNDLIFYIQIVQTTLSLYIYQIFEKRYLHLIDLRFAGARVPPLTRKYSSP